MGCVKRISLVPGEDSHSQFLTSFFSNKNLTMNGTSEEQKLIAKQRNSPNRFPTSVFFHINNPYGWNIS